MRCWIIGTLGFTVLVTPLRTAPVESPSEATPNLRAEAQALAFQLTATTQNISQYYVRAVDPSELIYAGLCGLYEASRQPVPGGLKQDLQAAFAKAAQGNGLDDLEAVHRVIVQARVRLGSLDILKGHRAHLLAVQAMIRVLDPHCGLITMQDGMAIARPNRNVGLDLDLGHGDLVKKAAMPGDTPLARMPTETPLGSWRIAQVIPGSPAQRAGLRPGDRITHVDDKSARDPDALGRLQRFFQADPQTREAKIQLTVRREGKADSLRVEVENRVYEPESVFGVYRQPDHSWTFLADRKHRLGFIRLGGITNASPTEMRNALAALKADQMRGLILDLRGCPGGYLNEAVEIAGMFLKEDLVVAKVKGRNTRLGGGGQEQETAFKSPIGGGLTQLPLVVLIGSETSGGGELIAASLQDHQRAVLVGQRTFGKASVQTPIDIGLGELELRLKLTTGTFQRPSGKTLQRLPGSRDADTWGVQPDAGYQVPVSPELAKQLKEAWLWQILRPGTSQDALPLDDPTFDCQLQAALAILRKRAK